MTTKLTLSISEKTIQRARLVSRKRGKSISKLVEEYLDALSAAEDRKESPIARIEEMLAGKITHPHLDWKDVKTRQLKKKYGI